MVVSFDFSDILPSCIKIPKPGTGPWYYSEDEKLLFLTDEYSTDIGIFNLENRSLGIMQTTSQRYCEGVKLARDYILVGRAVEAEVFDRSSRQFIKTLPWDSRTYCIETFDNFGIFGTRTEKPRSVLLDMVDIATGKLHQKLSIPKSLGADYLVMGISRENQYLIAFYQDGSYKDNRLLEWDLQNGAFMGSVSNHKDDYHVRMGHSLLVSENDLFELPSLTKIRSFNFLVNDKSETESVLGMSSKYLWTAFIQEGKDSRFRLFSIQNGSLVGDVLFKETLFSDIHDTTLTCLVEPFDAGNEAEKYIVDFETLSNLYDRRAY